MKTVDHRRAGITEARQGSRVKLRATKFGRQSSGDCVATGKHQQKSESHLAGNLTSNRNRHHNLVTLTITFLGAENESSADQRAVIGATGCKPGVRLVTLHASRFGTPHPELAVGTFRFTPIGPLRDPGRTRLSSRRWAKIDPCNSACRPPRRCRCHHSLVRKKPCPHHSPW